MVPPLSRTGWARRAPSEMSPEQVRRRYVDLVVFARGGWVLSCGATAPCGSLIIRGERSRSSLRRRVEASGNARGIRTSGR